MRGGSWGPGSWLGTQLMEPRPALFHAHPVQARTAANDRDPGCSRWAELESMLGLRNTVAHPAPQEPLRLASLP